jgi:protein-S-isoprenylcysteine O-methyltransferase Ste14
MVITLRHLLSILLLPFMAVIGVPFWLLTGFREIDYRWHGGWFDVFLPRCAGAVLFLGGLALFVWCVGLFAKIGKGTLAPWDPTHNLVDAGPYRFVRNPMISGVALMLLGEALFWGSWFVGTWTGIFLCINHIYFVLSEEPGMERRFGESYRVYKKNVPRWVPRLRRGLGGEQKDDDKDV